MALLALAFVGVLAVVVQLAAQSWLLFALVALWPVVLLSLRRSGRR